MIEKILVDIAGWAGVILLLVGYALVSTRRTEGDSILYQSLNVLGALCLIINSAYYGAVPSVTINIIWIGIALLALAKKRRSHRPPDP